MGVPAFPWLLGTDLGEEGLWGTQERRRLYQSKKEARKVACTDAGEVSWGSSLLSSQAAHSLPGNTAWQSPWRGLGLPENQCYAVDNAWVSVQPSADT